MSGYDQYTSGPLKGWSILVTRPREQADPLCDMIEHAGGQAVRFPVIEIRPVANLQSVKEQLDRLAQFDLMIFISRNAVEAMLPWLPAVRPAGIRVAAIGRATASALAPTIWQPDLVPADTFNSESLLALPQLQAMGGWRVLIVRGEGGRELLADTLQQRGATVEYANVYRRVMPQVDSRRILEPWLAHPGRIVIVTSAEGLHNLERMMAERAGILWQTPMVVISPRLQSLLSQRGMQARVVVARQADDASIFEALTELAGQATVR